MTNTDIYNQLFGLESPWRVSNVELDLHINQVRVYVEHDESLGSLECDTCRKPCPAIDLQESRSWRHLDTCQYMTYLICSLPRVECPTHGVRPAYVDWIQPNSQTTAIFERFANATPLAAQAQPPPPAIKINFWTALEMMVIGPFGMMFRARNNKAPVQQPMDVAEIIARAQQLDEEQKRRKAAESNATKEQASVNSTEPE